MIYFEIFWVFFKLSFISIGGVFGVLPELERILVSEKAWITHQQFVQSYVVGQLVPGPNMAMCPLIGYWIAGPLGAVAGFFGIYLGPVFVIGLATWIYWQHRHHPGVRRAEIALRPMVFGLITASAYRLIVTQTEAFPLGAFALLAAGVYLYSKKFLGAMGIVFLTGFAWYLITQFR